MCCVLLKGVKIPFSLLRQTASCHQVLVPTTVVLDWDVDGSERFRGEPIIVFLLKLTALVDGSVSYHPNCSSHLTTWNPHSIPLLPSLRVWRMSVSSLEAVHQLRPLVLRWLQQQQLPWHLYLFPLPVGPSSSPPWFYEHHPAPSLPTLAFWYSVVSTGSVTSSTSVHLSRGLLFSYGTEKISPPREEGRWQESPERMGGTHSHSEGLWEDTWLTK